MLKANRIHLRKAECSIKTTMFTPQPRGQTEQYDKRKQNQPAVITYQNIWWIHCFRCPNDLCHSPHCVHHESDPHICTISPDLYYCLLIVRFKSIEGKCSKGSWCPLTFSSELSFIWCVHSSILQNEVHLQTCSCRHIHTALFTHDLFHAVLAA